MAKFYNFILLWKCTLVESYNLLLPQWKQGDRNEPVEWTSRSVSLFSKSCKWDAPRPGRFPPTMVSPLGPVTCFQRQEAYMLPVSLKQTHGETVAFNEKLLPADTLCPYLLLNFPRIPRGIFVISLFRKGRRLKLQSFNLCESSRPALGEGETPAFWHQKWFYAGAALQSWPLAIFTEIQERNQRSAVVIIDANTPIVDCPHLYL